jgi:hypothetical protein
MVKKIDNNKSTPIKTTAPRKAISKRHPPSPNGNIVYNKPNTVDHNEDNDDDEDDEMDDAEKSDEETANSAGVIPDTLEPAEPSIETPLVRPTVNFTADTNILEYMIPASVVCGGSHKEKLNEILYDLQDKVSIVGRPVIKIRQLKDTTAAYIVVRVGETIQQDRIVNLSYKDTRQPDAETVYFKPFTTEDADHDRSRQVDVKSLKHGTTAAQIQGAFAAHGTIEHVRLWPTSRYHGKDKATAMVAATIYFADNKDVKKLQGENMTMIFVGTDSGRVTRLGNRENNFVKEWDVKLCNLLPNTTPLTLQKLYNEYRNCSITIPCNPITGRRHREAFISFTSEETCIKMTANDLKVSDTLSYTWAPVDQKNCFECGSLNHLVGACNVRLQRLETLQKKTAPVTGRSNQRYSGAVPRPVFVSDSQVVADKSYSQSVRPQPTQVTISSVVEQLTKDVATLTKQLAEMTERWREAQNHSVQMMDQRIQAMVTAVIHRLLPELPIPSTNESLAGIHETIVNQNGKRTPPSSSACVSNTQSSQNTQSTSNTQSTHISQTPSHHHPRTLRSHTASQSTQEAQQAHYDNFAKQGGFHKLDKHVAEERLLEEQNGFEDSQTPGGLTPPTPYHQF